MTNLILPRRGFLVGLASLLAAPAVVRAELLMPIKVWRPPLRWRDGYIVLNGAELKISEFPDLFDAFGHHFGGRGTTFRLPISGCPAGYESLTSVDAAWHGCFYPAVVGPFGRPDTVKIFDGGWRWEDFFRGPGVIGLRKGTLTYGRHEDTCAKTAWYPTMSGTVATRRGGRPCLRQIVPLGARFNLQRDG